MMGEPQVHLRTRCVVTLGWQGHGAKTAAVLQRPAGVHAGGDVIGDEPDETEGLNVTDMSNRIQCESNLTVYGC